MSRVFLTILWITTSALAQQPPVDPVFAEWKSKVDPAVENGLGYLQRIQKKDGSFEGSYGDSTGIPALVGMAFLSKGHLPTEGPYTTALHKCIDFILSNQKPDGVFDKGNAGEGPMYATYLPKQSPDGSWESREAGRTYGTAMMVLAFTVPWRQLPIYQRDETVDEEP